MACSAVPPLATSAHGPAVSPVLATAVQLQQTYNQTGEAGQVRAQDPPTALPLAAPAAHRACLSEGCLSAGLGGCRRSSATASARATQATRRWGARPAHFVL